MLQKTVQDGLDLSNKGDYLLSWEFAACKKFYIFTYVRFPNAPVKIDRELNATLDQV